MTTFVFKNSNNETARVEYASKNASKAKGKRGRKLDARVLAGSINTAHLCLTAEQSAALDAKQADVTEQIFSTSAQDQDAAHALLSSLKLEPGQLADVSNRWSIRWSDKIGKEGAEHALYQCNCGYEHTLNGSEKRHVPFPFTSCLAHVEVTYWPTKDTILRVRGLATHNEACSQAEICAAPKIPLHPAVFEAALQQLRLGAALTDIQEQNRRIFLARGFRDQPADLRESNFRWILQQSDMRTLYRQYGRLHGVDLQDRPEQNVQNWLDPASPTYHRALAEAVFHYSPRATQGERLKICIATPAMHEASWRYAHKSQLVLDGTFGLCDKRMLLFIAMGIDENGHGVPLAFFLFSSAVRTRILELPGGAALLAAKEQAARCAALQPVAYYSICEQRDAAAVQILYHKQLAFQSSDAAGARFSCFSSLATRVDKAPVTYDIVLRFNGLASCTCADFRKVGGACKHLRAALVRYEQVREDLLLKGQALPLVPLPCTEAEAREIAAHASAAELCPEATPSVPNALHSAAIDIAEALDHGEDIFEPEDAADDAQAGLEGDEDEQDSTEAADMSEHDTDEYDFLPPSSAKRGLEQQSAGRLEFHLGRLVPKLGDMLELAQSIREPAIALKELAAHAATAFASLAAEMCRIADLHPGEYGPQACVPPNTPLPHNRKRRRPLMYRTRKVCETNPHW